MSEPGRMKMLGELASLRTEKVTGRKDPNKPYVGLEHMASGDPFLLGVAQSYSSVSTNSLFYRGDVLFGKLRPNLRKSLPAPFDGYCSTDILVLQPVAGCDQGFVARVFQREDVFAEAVRTAEGTKMPRTSWARMRGCTVFSPEDDAERQAIARILDAADEAIAKTEALIAKLKAIKQGLLHDLLTRGLDDNGELRDPEKHPEQFKGSPLGQIPKAWGIYTIDSLTESAVLGLTARGTDASGDNIPLLKMGNLVWGGLDLTKVEFLRRASIADTKQYLLQDGDFLFNTRNTPDLVGKTAVWDSRLPESVFDNNLLRIRFKPGVVSRFICAYMSQGEGKQRVKRMSMGTTSVAAIYWGSLGRYLVPLPLVEIEQLDIVQRFTALDQRISAEEDYLRKKKSLKKGLMQDLLSGRVRVRAEKAPAVTG